MACPWLVGARCTPAAAIAATYQQNRLTFHRRERYASSDLSSLATTLRAGGRTGDPNLHNAPRAARDAFDDIRLTVSVTKVVCVWRRAAGPH